MDDRTWDVMQQHLESGVYNIFSAQDSAPTEADLRAVAQTLGCTLPDDFVAHATHKYGGLYVEVNEDLWPRAEEGSVGPFWSFLYGLYTLNCAEGIPDFMDLEPRARSFQSETGHTAIPCLKLLGDADQYCINQDGTVVHWDHETNELSETGKSFWEVLDLELAELAERKNRKLAEQRS